MTRLTFRLPSLALVTLSSLFGSLAGCGEEADPLVEEKPLSTLAKELRSDNRGIQLRASKALAKAPAELHARITPLVLPVLKSQRENDKFVAAQVLGAYGPAARVAVPDLLPMLQGTQFERNRAAAAKALGQILKDAAPSEEVEQATLALTRKFNEEYDAYSDVRRESVYALGMIGPAAKSCIPKLHRALTDYVQYSDEHRMVRQAAAWTCSRMGPLAAEHMDRLIAMLRSEGTQIPEVVVAIGNIGAINDNVVANILDFMEPGPAWTMLEPWQALQKFGPKSERVIPFAKRFLTNPSFYGQHHPGLRQLAVIEALKLLQVVGPKAVDVLPQVESLINYKYPYDEKHAETPFMRQEAAKTAALLKGAAPQNGEMAAPGTKPAAKPATPLKK